MRADTDLADVDQGGFDPAAIRPVFVGVLVGLSLAAISQTFVSTALPTMVGELGGYGGLSWVVSAYLLSSAVIVPIAGKLADVYGSARLFRISILVFAAGSLLGGLSTSMPMLIAARGVQGVGGGAILTVSFTLIAHLVPSRERGRYQSKVASLFAITSVAGPLVGGFFVDHLSWRWAFFTVTALCGVALAVGRGRLPADVRRDSPGFDAVGVALILLIVVGSMLLAGWGGQRYAWTSPELIGLVVICVVGSLVFAWWESRSSHPIVPVRLLRLRAVWTGTTLGFLSSCAMFGMIVYAPTFLQVSLGATATVSGLLLIPLMGCVLIGSTVGGRVMSKSGKYRSLAVTGSVLLAVGAGLLTTMGTATPIWLPSVYVGVVGAGIGLTMPVAVVAVQNSVDPTQLGAATSLTQFVRKIGSTVGVAVLGGLFAARVAASLDASGSSLPSDIDPESLLETPAAIDALPAEIAAIVRDAVASGATASFVIAFVVALMSFAVSLWMPNEVLSDAQPAPDDVSDAVTG